MNSRGKPWTRKEWEAVRALRDKGLRPCQIQFHVPTRTAQAIARIIRIGGPRTLREESTESYDGPPIGLTREDIELRNSAMFGSRDLLRKIGPVKTEKADNSQLSPFERQERALARGVPLIEKGKTSPYQMDRSWS